MTKFLLSVILAFALLISVTHAEQTDCGDDCTLSNFDFQLVPISAMNETAEYEGCNCHYDSNSLNCQEFCSVTMQPVLDEVEDHNEGSFWNFETDQIQQQEDDAEYAQLKAKMHFDGSVSYSLDFDTNTNEDQSMNHPEMVSFASPAEMEQFLSLLVDESGHPAYTMKWNDEEIHMSGNEYDDQVPHDFYEYQPHYQAGEGQFPMIQVPM